MEQELKEIILAAWLHDIGKFAQRADIKEYRYNNESLYCPFQEKGGYYSHKHVLYTAGTLEALKDFLLDDVRVSNVIQLAAKHHSPSSEFEQIIAEADRLSSGSDRTNEFIEQQILDNEEKKQFYEKPLIHQMSVLKLEEREKTNLVFCKVEALEKDNILPTANSKIGKEDYKKLWDKFELDFKELKNLKFDEYIIALESLLERYWWCIPSSTINDADISLFQHAKTTAAFATCLYYFHKSNNSLKDVEISNRKIQKFVFINGDMSGIQKYIFDLKTSDNNAKLLRARSFQLFALGKMIAEFIIESFDLSNANIITSAGGKFMLILPATENVTQKIPLLQTEIEEYFVKEFAGKLCFILSDGVLASGEDVIQKKSSSFAK